nr:ADP-ribosylation factor-binding protein GGA1-like isoform X1 [Cherax quadricarinatus]
MIKLVSPKYLGNHTHIMVKTKVVELLYTWTIDLKAEPKILEAYNMLKKQGVVKDDPQYIGAPTVPEPRSRANAVFEDEEKSRLLQRLLQSKNPEDLHKANALIKSMVKEDERRMERTSRRIVEVQEIVQLARRLLPGDGFEDMKEDVNELLEDDDDDDNANRNPEEMLTELIAQPDNRR